MIRKGEDSHERDYLGRTAKEIQRYEAFEERGLQSSR